MQSGHVHELNISPHRPVSAGTITSAAEWTADFNAKAQISGGRPTCSLCDNVTRDISSSVAPGDKSIVWLRGEVRTPPFSRSARLEAGWLLRRLQAGESLGMPYSRPMPTLGPRCHELRIVDIDKTWRVIYRLDPEAVVIADVFPKTTMQTPRHVIADCRRRLRRYDIASRGGE